MKDRWHSTLQHKPGRLQSLWKFVSGTEKKKLGSQSFELIIQNLEEITPNFELGIPKFWVNKLKICVIIELWVTVFFPEAEKIFLRKILIEIW